MQLVIHHSTYYWLDYILSYCLYLVACNVLLFQIQIYHEANLTVDITLHTIIKYSCILLSKFLFVADTNVQCTVTKQSHYRYHTAHSHKTFLYLIVLMLIYCKYKSTVTELITLQIIHCTPYLIFFYICPNFCVLQIQMYCYESNHRSGIILLYAVSSCISFNDHHH
jgi:hypothetical protein